MPSTAPNPAASNPTNSDSDSDPNRPVLRRRGAGENPSRTSTSAAPNSGAARNPNTDPDLGPLATPAPAEVLVAVSDARTLEAHHYEFSPKPDERQRLTSAMRALALAEIDRASRAPAPAQSPARRPTRGAAASRTPRPAAAPTQRRLEVVDLRFFDVDYDNSSELVLTARAPAASNIKDAFVTIVARVDLGGDPRKLFSLVTTSDRLDSYPRLQLIDAVDADGDGRAELLFRQFTSSTASFAIYRVGRDQLTRIFQGGSAD